MYNILITDDEQIAVDSLSFIINKNFEGQIKITTALSGTEALEIVSKENIDIIFMDINMPGLNGLETVSCIKKLKPETVTIILSAFDRFQYAQEAMNLGAFKYITKPVNRNILIQTIRSAMDFIDSKRGKQNEDIEFHKKLDFVSPMIESDFIFACIYNNEADFNLESYLEYFSIDSYSYMFCCMEFPNINAENKHKTYLQIRDILNKEHRCLVSSFMMNRMVFLYSNLDRLSEEAAINDIKSIFSTLCFNISSGIRAGISKLHSDWVMLKPSYNEALSCLNKTDASGGIIFAGSLQNQNENAPEDLSDIKKKLYNRLKQGDSNGLAALFDLYSKQIEQQETDLNKIKNAFFELIVTARNLTVEIDNSFLSDSFDNVFSALSTENDFQMLKVFVQKTLMEYLSVIINTREHSENPIIKKACEYIDKNLAQDISLDQVASHVNVSTFYLSKLFKEEKNITFVNFLTDKRLDKSRTLLKQSNLSIKEITSECGWNDQNYFSRIFKNKYGLTPSEYRSEI